MNGVDTNILIYSVDVNEPIKQLKAQQLLQQLARGPVPTLLPWQVIAEFLQQLRKWKSAGKIDHAKFVQHIQTYRLLFPLVFPRADIIDRSLALSEKYSLSHWDSMILAACQSAGITTLYTEDMGAPRTIDGISLVNPF
ncbi:PIN domain-containing protein [Anatilimnocola floriformis]|uniref:PIN domain-containing protein n=1 Tax=Anatilimnocola floriformis TaxID=2948575 RepID=UPI0020C2A293|nr:PIN domain-containing protein [Anatilimnocola floriformis]